MRSPWGRVFEEHPGGRGRGKPRSRQERRRLQDAEPHGRRTDRLDRRTDAGRFRSQSANPGQFATNLTFFAFTIIILGGLGRVKGPIIGAIIFFFVIQFVDNVLSEATRNDVLPDWLVTGSNFGQVKFIVAGVILALLVVFRPQGIFGDRREQVFDVR